MKKNIYDQIKDHPRFPNKMEVIFETASQGWDSHTEHLRGRLDGNNEMFDYFISFLKSIGMDKEKIKYVIDQDCEEFSPIPLNNNGLNKIASALCQQNIIGDIK